MKHSLTRSALVQARIDPQIKENAMKNLKRFGLSISEFIRLKIAEAAHTDNELRPNKDTLDAIERLNAGEGLHFQNVEDMFSYLEKR